MTIHELLIQGARMLSSSSDAPEVDSQYLLLHVLDQKDRSYLATFASQPVSGLQEKEFLVLVNQRLSGIPLAYLLGEAEFYGRLFTVTKDVLIPRPSTEELIEKSLTVIQTMSEPFGRRLTVADIGTGSGCIAITLLLESPFIDHIFAIDISATALEVARENAKRYGVEDRITFLHGTMLEPLSGTSIDLIVSNPPYVPTAELTGPPTLETKGLLFEPRIALDGGVDGLDYVSIIKDSGIPAIIEGIGGAISSYLGD